MTEGDDAAALARRQRRRLRLGSRDGEPDARRAVEVERDRRRARGLHLRPVRVPYFVVVVAVVGVTGERRPGL
jgi:hypothetical protein